MNPLLRILLESSIRITAAAILAGLALSLARVRASAVNHAVWTGVLCAMLLMPALPYLVPPLTVPVATPKVMIVAEDPSFYTVQPPTVAVDSGQSTFGSASLPLPAVPTDSPDWPIATLGVWGAGVLSIRS
jgi:hypothetical protein